MRRFKDLMNRLRGIELQEEDEVDEQTPVKVRMDKSPRAKAARKAARLKYKRDRVKIAMQRKKKRKQEKSSGVEKKRARLKAQGKTLSGKRITKRVS